MLTAIVLLGSVVSSPVTLALAVMPLAASPTFLDGITCDVEVTDDTRLQAAIASSVDDSVICIRESIQLSATLTLANTSVALVGRDDSAVTLTAPASSRHISANSSTPSDDTLVIDTLTLRGGGAAVGGGIAADDYAIYTRDSTLHENNAGAADGGAIHAINGDVTIDDSTTFTNNSADDTIGVGGAIYVLNGDVTINGNSTFIENTAGVSGGAIYAANGHVTITDTTAFTDNDAANGYGGAIYARFNVTTSGGTFSDNDALLSGGAIYSILGKVSVDDSTTFTNNSADDTYGFGGAISANGDVTTSGGNFTNNTAGSDGGAIYSATGRVTIDDTASTTGFTNNTATIGRGGAIYADDTVTTSGGTFTNNTAGFGGGAIYTDAGGVSINGTTEFTDNDVTFAGGVGGAIYAFNGDVTTSGGTFTYNDAGGGGGAIYAFSGDVTIDDTASTTDFTDNTAIAGGGSGGAIFAGGEVTTNGGTFSNNDAGGLGGGGGGAIYANGDVTIDDSTTFTGNDATDGSSVGGAIYAGLNVTTSGGTFTDNTAGFGGGAIYANGDVTTSGGTFTDDTAGFGGGAIYANGDVTTSGGTFTDNTAGGALGGGGAIWARYESIYVTNSTFFGNSAPSGGAALSLGDISLRYTTAVDDSTNLGGVFESGGNLTVLGSVIAPEPASGSACSASADDSSYKSFVTDSSCGSGDDTVVVTSRADIGLSGPLVTDASTGAQVLIPDDTSILINAAPAALVAGVTTDQLQATRGRSPDDSTTVGAVQVLPLVITGQPASTTVAAGATTTFAASGLPGVGTTVNYQWQTRANAGASWVDRVGATSPTLTLASVSAGQNGLQVRALVSDTRNEPLTSSVATLTVTSSPGPGPAPAVVPGAPRNPRAVPGNEGAEVTWLAPLSSGTYPITSYEVVNDINGTICRLTDGPNTALSCAMTGLTNGSSYRFRVRALSSAGAGEWSPWSNAVTPSAPPTPRTLVITGTRDGAKVRIRGASTGLSGAVAAPWVRLAGQVGYKQGINVRPIAANGSFNWSRTSLRKTYVYFTADGIVSNRVIFPSAR